jgi:hypothetical protein
LPAYVRGTVLIVQTVMTTSVAANLNLGTPTPHFTLNALIQLEVSVPIMHAADLFVGNVDGDYLRRHAPVRR